jgi:4'-phosphopantetheinyl transferase
LTKIEIRAEPSGAPKVFLENEPANIAISLSHRSGTAICALADSGAALGCDLEIIEPRSDAFVTDYFTAEEQAFVNQSQGANRSQLLALLWSGKESALKALGVGLRLDTRSLVVNSMGNDPAPDLSRSFDSHDWHPFDVRFGADIFQGWWQLTHNFLRTLVAAPAPSQPIPLVILE